MVKRVVVEQDILDGAIERAIEDLASRSGLSAEVVRQMATDGTPFVRGSNRPGCGAVELNRGLALLREAIDGNPREYWLKWYKEGDDYGDTLGRKHRRVRGPRS